MNFVDRFTSVVITALLVFAGLHLLGIRHVYAQAVDLASVSGLNNNTFGQITSTQSTGPGQLGTNRILQFALKLHF